MTIRLFGTDIIELFENRISSVERSISTESEDYILNVNEEDYIAHLFQSIEFDIPVLEWDSVSADSYEKTFEEHDRHFGDVYHTKRQVFQFFVPISGDKNLLGYHQARTLILSGFSPDAKIKNGHLVLEFVQRGTDVSGIKNQYDKTQKEVISRLNSLTGSIENFHREIKADIRTKFTERKERILHQKNQLASLGVPIRKATTSTTFSVPKPELRKKIEVKPIVSEKGFVPEPALSDEEYKIILKYIDDVGKNFERLPNLYKGKREEHLRDHIIMVLDPNFQMGSATGETFNKNGKTDIMLNYNGNAVFIAECKYWTGEKGFSETIDQLLSYLTWRNSKASVIMFVKEKDFSSIIQKAVETTKKHPNYSGEIGKSDESWFNFRFHLNGDSNRELKLAVQLFHVPK